MFTLGVITDEVSQDLTVALDLARRFNLDTVEIRTVWEKPPQDLTSAEIERIKTLVSEAGLTVVSIASPFYKCDIDDQTECQAHIEILKRSIALAQALGANIVRTFAFWRKGKLEDCWNKVLARYALPLQIAASEGVYLGLENEASTMIGTGRDLRRLVDALGSPHLLPLWDPCNEFFDPHGETPYPDGYRHVRDDMLHMHIKDARRNPDRPEGAECVPLGTGEIDYRGHLKALPDDGYQGSITLETHWRPTREQLHQDLLDRPGGSAFSELGEEASRICLENWLAMLQEIGLKRQ